MAASMADLFDAELVQEYSNLPFADLTRDKLVEARAACNTIATLEGVLSAYPSLKHEEKTIPGPHGEITLSIFRPSGDGPKPDTPNPKRPAFYFAHAGGMVLGNRFLGSLCAAEWAVKFNAVSILVEYRLAPEHPAPIPVDECYTGLKWVSDNALSLGIDAERIILSGRSGGGALAAGTALMARDRGGPKILAQLLMFPMLDDRMQTTSSEQFAPYAPWPRAVNAMAWECVLGEGHGDKGNESISPYSAPGRAADLSGLPQTFIEVGAAEVVRDEAVSYGSRLWAAGVNTELHVWAGGFHSFDDFVPHATLSKTSMKMRVDWLARVLGVNDGNHS